VARTAHAHNSGQAMTTYITDKKHSKSGQLKAITPRPIPKTVQVWMDRQVSLNKIIK